MTQTKKARVFPSAASLPALLESVPALIWETDGALRVTNLSGAFERVGLSPDRYIGLPAVHLFPSAARAHEAALLGERAAFEAEVNGRVLEATVQPSRGPDAVIGGVIGIAIDMTERMVADRALRISEYSYRTLIEEAPYAMCRCTVGGQLLQANRAMAEMLGYDGLSNSSLLLRDLPQIFTPASSFDAFRDRLLAAGSDAGTGGKWLRRDGQTIQVRLCGRAMRNAAGEISHFDVFAEDVTEKKQLEEELSHAQRMLAVGQLAGGVAHDFNNLLTVISGHVEILLARPPNADAAERLEEVKQAAGKAASLTRQLLAFSRRQVLLSRTLDLNEVIRKVRGMLGRLIKENVELEFVPAEDLGMVKADPNAIERVLVNLAVNAQDAMPRGGRLTIETSNVTMDEHTAQHGGLRPGNYVQMLRPR